jgi:signal transduction histidine kinase
MGDSVTNDAGRMAELERQNAQLLTQLLQAQKMTALGELLSTTTHEFNNVLTTILNYAKLGIRHRDDAARDKAFQKILAAGERAAQISSSVLGMARNRNDRFEPTPLKAIVQQSLFLLEREMNKYRIAVECDLRDVPDVCANPNQIQQVLLNLLINARQAMPRGGTITVRLIHDAAARTVDLVVRDTGVGIAAHDLPHIFDAFYTTKDGPDASGKGGTGLGLAACRNIVEAHRGRIRVESTAGRGTAFTIKLPIAETKPAVALPGAPRAETPPSHAQEDPGASHVPV